MSDINEANDVNDINVVNDDYVAGDVNTIDDGYDDDGNDDVNESSSALDNAATATAVLEFIATSLAEDPSAVSVDVSERQGKVVLSLSVGSNDMGRIIGRRGRTAQAIRALVGAAGARDGVTTSVDIVD
ncbi:MAG: KH domain-containing protein [Acidimicrobiales bacterium]